jgi:hypothetical protein
MSKKFWIKFRWSKTPTWYVVDKDKIVNHLPCAIVYSQDNEPDVPVLRMISIYFFKFNVNFIWTP